MEVKKIKYQDPTDNSCYSVIRIKHDDKVYLRHNAKYWKILVGTVYFFLWDNEKIEQIYQQYLRQTKIERICK